MRRESIKKNEEQPLSPREKEFNKTSAELKQLSKELEEKRKKLSETSDEYIAVSNKLAEVQKTISEEKTVLSKIIADKDSVVTIKSSVLEEIGSFKEKKALADEELTKYKNSLIMSQEDFKTDLEKERAELISEKRKLEATISQKKIELGYFEDRIADSEKREKELSDTFKSNCLINKQLEDSIEGKKKVLEDIEKIVEHNSAESTKLLTFKTELSAAKEKLEKENEALKKEKELLQNDIDEKKSTMGRLFLRESLIKEQAHILKDFYTKNGMKIPEQLNF